MRTSNPVSFSRRNGASVTTPDVASPIPTPGPPLPFTPEKPEARVRKILRMVETGTTFTIRNLALEFHLSPSYLQRLFKLQTGVSMGEW